MFWKLIKGNIYNPDTAPPRRHTRNQRVQVLGSKFISPERKLTLTSASPTSGGASTSAAASSGLLSRGFDMINPGPGYLDVGTMSSPLSLATAPSTLLPQMSPFIPRPGPPHPVRIDLAEPHEEVYKKFVMTTTKKGNNKYLKIRFIKILFFK